MKEDYIRLGTYAQLQGHYYRARAGGYMFHFGLKTISDMQELAERATGKTLKPNTRKCIHFSSKKLYDEITKLGFTNFHRVNWNVPPLTGEDFDVYLAAVIDSIGCVFMDGDRPKVVIKSINENGIKHLAGILGGRINIDSDNLTRLTFNSSDSFDMVKYVGERFRNPSNQRGVEMIEQLKWETFI